MKSGRQSSGRRRKLLAWAVGLIVFVGVVLFWSVGHHANRPGAPIESASASNAVLTGVAGVFDERLAGFQVSNATEFADYLSAVRPEVRNNPDWPESDYALLSVPRSQSSDAQAVGVVVWVGGPGTATGWATVCAEASVDRAAARLRLREMRCPLNVPSEPVQIGAPQERAGMLDLRVDTRGDLVAGDSGKSGMTIAGGLPTNPARAEGRCSASDLSAIFDSGNAAGNTDAYILRVQNVSAKPCELLEATGIEIDLGKESLQPPWVQASSTVTLQSWESAATTISYRPAEVSSARQSIIMHLPTGAVRVGAPAGPSGATLSALDSTPISATPWEVIGYGAGNGRWENGYLPIDIAPRCKAQQIAVTTPPATGHSAGQEEPYELPYRLLNISTGTCRIDAGAFTGLQAVPPLNFTSTVVLQPGTATDLDVEGGAADLSGTLIVDGVQVRVKAP